MKLPETMKAVVIHGIGDYRFEEIPIPQLGVGEVLVRVKAAGICAGDVKAFHGIRVWGSDDIVPYIKVPVVAGHENIGEVVALGEGAAEKYGLKIGDMAVSEQIVPCGKCRFCLEGKYWMCEQHDIYGFIHERAEGGWSEYMRYPTNAINYKVPSDVKSECAALIEPLACAIHAVERGNIQLRDVVVIAGMGPIGLCMLQIARLKSPGLLIAVDMKPYRLRLAHRLGADLVIDVSKGDVVEEVKKLTDGYGCDVYIDVAGSSEGTIQGLRMLRKLGTFVEFAVHSKPLSVDWSIIGDVKELNIYGSHLGAYSYPKAIEYLHDGTINAEEIVTHILPLEKFQQGLEISALGEKSLKVILVP